MDALAIAIGTSHGAYKFTRKPTGDLAMDRIVRVNSAIPGTHLVMHGSSSVPQEWLAIIRKYGGEIKDVASPASPRRRAESRSGCPRPARGRTSVHPSV